MLRFEGHEWLNVGARLRYTGAASGSVEADSPRTDPLDVRPREVVRVTFTVAADAPAGPSVV